jgi:hypothetical protein
MKSLKIALTTAMFLLGSAALANSNTASDESSDGDAELERAFWTCRADARDDSGLFFLGMGPTRAEAYIQAFESCNRQNRSCIITCSQDINW